MQVTLGNLLLACRRKVRIWITIPAGILKCQPLRKQRQNGDGPQKATAVIPLLQPPSMKTGTATAHHTVYIRQDNDDNRMRAQ